MVLVFIWFISAHGLQCHGQTPEFRIRQITYDRSINLIANENTNYPVLLTTLCTYLKVYLTFIVHLFFCNNRLPRMFNTYLYLIHRINEYVQFRYDHQERLTAMEAMEHAYFYPVVKDHGRISNISNSPTGGASGLGPGSIPQQVPSSPILSPNNTPLPSNQQNQP